MQFLVTRSAVNLGSYHYLSSGEVGKTGNKKIYIVEWVEGLCQKCWLTLISGHYALQTGRSGNYQEYSIRRTRYDHTV